MKTNTELQHDVLEELEYEPSIDSAGIGVTAKDGIVTLNGSVESYAEKLAAARAAERVVGVRAVIDELRVDLPNHHERNDEDIARAALNALMWDVEVPHSRIKLKVDQGRITLEGDVVHRYQKDACENALHNLTGVKSIINLIDVVKPAIHSWDIKSKIESALRRAAELDARKIRVEVDNDKVILTGVVSSWAERSAANKAAAAAPGVREVEDHLSIAA